MQKINADFVVPFIDATQSTFEMMLNLKLKQKEAYVKKNYVMFGDISGFIGVSGNVCGFVSVSLPTSFALGGIRSLIGEEEGAFLSDMVVHEGVGELFNMIAGGAKTTLSVSLCQRLFQVRDTKYIVKRVPATHPFSSSPSREKS